LIESPQGGAATAAAAFLRALVGATKCRNLDTFSLYCITYQWNYEMGGRTVSKSDVFDVRWLVYRISKINHISCAFSQTRLFLFFELKVL
jgi:hypothetical protein